MINLVSEGCVKVNNELIMTARGMNLIYKVNLENGKLELQESIPDENHDAGRLSGEILKYENEIVFLPMNARRINIYDICKKKWRYIELEEIEDCYLDKFFSGVIEGNYLYMIGSKYPAIVKVNLQDDHDIKYIKGPYEVMNHEKDDCFVRRDITLVDGKIYMASCVNNYVFEIDLESDEIKQYDICDVSKSFSGIAYDGNNFWLSSRMNREIFRWNPLNNDVDSFNFGSHNNNNSDCCWGGIVFDKKHIIAYGMDGNSTIIINPFAENVIENAFEINESYSFVKNIDDSNYVMGFNGKLGISKVSDGLSIMKSFNTLVEEYLIYDYIKEKGAIVHENPFLSLVSFLNGIV